MCGITGWVDHTRDLSGQGPLLTAMATTMAPRGPDGSGVWLSPHAALGHRRLALIDLATGGQPMTPAGPAPPAPPARPRINRAG